MTKAELIKRLAAYDDDSQVMILDDENGCGIPREINLGPTIRVIKETDADEVSDCEGLVGSPVIVIGYGSY